MRSRGMRHATLLPLNFLLFLACGDAPGDTTDSAETGTTAGEEAALTYYRDIKAILDGKCVALSQPWQRRPLLARVL